MFTEVFLNRQHDHAFIIYVGQDKLYLQTFHLLISSFKFFFISNLLALILLLSLCQHSMQWAQFDAHFRSNFREFGNFSLLHQLLGEKNKWLANRFFWLCRDLKVLQSFSPRVLYFMQCNRSRFYVGFVTAKCHWYGASRVDELSMPKVNIVKAQMRCDIKHYQRAIGASEEGIACTKEHISAIQVVNLKCNCSQVRGKYYRVDELISRKFHCINGCFAEQATHESGFSRRGITDCDALEIWNVRRHFGAMFTG